MNPFFQIRFQHRLSDTFSMDLDISTPARSMALSGPSGCGKTTVVRVLAGLIRPDVGQIQVGDRCFQNDGVWLNPAERRVGLVMQDGLLFPLLDVRQNMLSGAERSRGRTTLEEVADVLDVAHLLDRRTRNLSGGERQRVALGRAILSDPDLLLCDEPFSALDHQRRTRLIGMLQRVQEKWSVPLVLVSHDRSNIDALVQSVYDLDGGTVVRVRGVTSTEES